MGITAKWTTTCAGCGKVVENEITLDTDTARLNYFDIWGPGWPKEWIQCSHDEVTDLYYLFFHSKDCHYAWLEKQGRFEEVEKAKKAVWVA